MPGRSAIHRVAAFAAAALMATAIGCGSDSNEGAPAACVASSDAYLRALESAPDQVRLDGEVPISDCLVPSQEGGELANVGEELVVTASTLNAEARANPGGAAAMQLGYLIGAVSKGADSIHTDLVRRLDSSAQFSETGETLPPQFQRSFGRGYTAGLQSG
jgi:hypothetical protein